MNTAIFEEYYPSVLDYAAGIETTPIILSTRAHGKIALDYPFDHFTNYVVALVNTETPFICDGTEDMLPFDRLPNRCLNDKGILVDENEPVDMIELKSYFVALEKHIINLKIDPNSLDANASVIIQSSEAESFWRRKQFLNDNEKIKEYYSENFTELNEVKTAGFKKLSSQYTISLKGTVETEKLGSNLVIKPFMNFPLSKNVLTQEERTYPVDFVNPWKQLFECTIQIPDGYAVSELPADYQVIDDQVAISLAYTNNNNLLQIKGRVHFKHPTYSPAEYTMIKDYLDQVVEKFNTLVVIEKM